MDKKSIDIPGININGNITFHGPMFDIHDNQNVYINGKSLRQAQEPSPRQNQEPRDQEPTQTADDFKPSGRTFTKTALLDDRLIDIMAQRLARANKLSASPDDFRKLFSGIDQQFTMTWLGTGGELRDLFKMLTDKKLQFAKPQKGYQQILKSHFLDEDGNRFNNLHGDKSIESFQPVIDDCAFLLQYLTDGMTEIMKQLVSTNRSVLQEMGFFDPLQAVKQSNLSIRNKRR